MLGFGFQDNQFLLVQCQVWAAAVPGKGSAPFPNSAVIQFMIAHPSKHKFEHHPQL